MSGQRDGHSVECAPAFHPGTMDKRGQEASETKKRERSAPRSAPKRQRVKHDDEDGCAIDDDRTPHTSHPTEEVKCLYPNLIPQSNIAQPFYRTLTCALSG